MRPNCRILREQLDLDKEGVKKLLLFFPAVLCYNPMTLQRACRQALAMLTGDPPLSYCVYTSYDSFAYANGLRTPPLDTL